MARGQKNRRNSDGGKQVRGNAEAFGTPKGKRAKAAKASTIERVPLKKVMEEEKKEEQKAADIAQEEPVELASTKDNETKAKKGEQKSEDHEEEFDPFAFAESGDDLPESVPLATGNQAAIEQQAQQENIMRRYGKRQYLFNFV
jgi:hypothetical protein